MAMFDPYEFLCSIADALWDLHESTDGDASDQAEKMYNTLQNDYLEPFRKKNVQADTQAYAQLKQKLQAGLQTLDKRIQEVNGVSDKMQQVAQYSQMFDQIVSVAAGLA
jgi:hypothetical protein